MVRRFVPAVTALMLMFLAPKMALGQPWVTSIGCQGINGGLAFYNGLAFSVYDYPIGCMAWDGYRWLNMCYRSRKFVQPEWTRFH